jgi:hypothetical protein
MGTLSREERRENQDLLRPKLGGIRNFAVKQPSFLKMFYSYSPRDRMPTSRLFVQSVSLHARRLTITRTVTSDGSSLRFSSSVLYVPERESRRSGNAHAISSNADDLGT